jgi:hypothetical protein
VAIEPQSQPRSATRSLAPSSPYSAYFEPREALRDPSTICLPGSDPRKEVVVRPALAILFRIAVGPSADRYVRRFLAFERRGGGRPGWHWPSLLFPGVWAFYRKMWITGLLYALLPAGGALAFALVAPRFEHADVAWIACAVAAIWLLPGVVPALLAESLLYNHIRHLVAKAERGARGATDAVQRLSMHSPTSLTAATVLGGGMLLFMLGVIVPPLYDAYTELNVRAQISQALVAVRGLEGEVESGWPTARLVPRQTDNPAVRSHAGADVIEDVHVHPLTGRIRLAFRAAAPVLDGKTILLAPARGDNNQWHWLCIPVGIPLRYLPTECRG